MIRKKLFSFWLLLIVYKDKINVDFSKNQKFIYYLRNLVRLAIPDFFYTKKIDRILKSATITEEILNRVNYYNKLDNTFELADDAVSIEVFKKTSKKKTYYFDLIEYLRYFNSKNRFTSVFGDVTWVPQTPSFLKSRPIEGDNRNSVLMKLNKIRHFTFVDDSLKFEDKINKIVWRGKCYIPHRQVFIKEFYDKKYCDIGQTNTKEERDVPWQKSRMKIGDQLKYKFVLAIEGNDVATNLKWVMSSNSIAFMVKPKYETWFMEGALIPNYHYVLLKNDYSDLEEKINYYSENINESLKIIENANKFVAQFKDPEKEDLISLLVLKKYFQKSKQGFDT